MLDILIALLPVIVASVYFYGAATLEVIGVSIACSVIAEVLFNMIVKRKQTIKDLSAVVTGLILALILPYYLPLWTVGIGAIFATIVVKLFFGGLGQNFVNPAATAKVFLIASWAGLMSKPVNSAANAWPLGNMENGFLQLILGQNKGNMGEVSILAILVGGIYLIARKKISFVTPFTMILSAIILTAALGKDITDTVVVGSIAFVAFFMAVEPHTTPYKNVGRAIFGILVGVMSVIFIVLGHNPDGPYYAVIFMNLFTPMINHFTDRKVELENGHEGVVVE